MSFYLEPHRFITRQSEVAKERPGKELILDEASRISVRDKQHREKCTIQNELQLSEDGLVVPWRVISCRSQLSPPWRNGTGSC